MFAADLDPPIILFDIVSTCSKPWNPNTWKARTVLNYKRIPYKTIWLSYPDIEPTLKKLGASPHTVDPAGNPHYMLPALLDTSSITPNSNPARPVIITDSLKIAEYLDMKYPDRRVFPKEGRALEYIFEETFNRIVGPSYWRMMLPLAWDLLDERSQAYFQETWGQWRTQRQGYASGNKKLIARRPYVTEQDWELLKGGFDKLARILDRNGDRGEDEEEGDGKGSVFVAGGVEPTRADMIIVAYLAAIVVAAPERWEKEVRHWGGGRWEKLWKVSERWRVVV